jgi:Na+/alanine symporter
MSKAGRSLFIFGIYTLVNGLGLLLIPNIFLALFGLPGSDEIWIRVAGWLVGLLGFYYLIGGYRDLTEFIRLTVPGRAAVFAFYVVIVLLGLIQPIVLVVGVVDLLGALWTAAALRQD